MKLVILSLPRIPPGISTVYWSFISLWEVGEQRNKSLLWFTLTGVQSKTLSACGCLRQWEVHVFVNVLHGSPPCSTIDMLHCFCPPSSLKETLLSATQSLLINNRFNRFHVVYLLPLVLWSSSLLISAFIGSQILLFKDHFQKTVSLTL